MAVNEPKWTRQPPVMIEEDNVLIVKTDRRTYHFKVNEVRRSGIDPNTLIVEAVGS